MLDTKKKNKEIEEKYNIFKKEIQNERMFLFRINQFFNDEFDDMIEDILSLNESKFMSQLKNRVEKELEEIYSDKIFSEKKFTNILEKAFNSIKTDYKPDFQLLNTIYDNYLKNKNSKKGDIEFLTDKYRRHCIKGVDNEFATHTCNYNLGKFILVKKNGNIEFVICSNCKKVYYSNMILCKCYKCNKEYYTEILSKNDDEFLLPATWENYHCKQIVNEKIKCIKCHEVLYINLKTGMLNCLNKKCSFNSKPNKILWTCAICQEDFKSGAIPYNPLDLEIIKKVVKQTLLQKQKAHPNIVPCCKINVFFTEFYHKKKCPGILYTGELNGDIIIVCEKCHAINYYNRFIWTCPKCGGKFSDEKNGKNEKNVRKDDNSFNDENNEDTTNINSYNTISIGERTKSNLNNSNNNNNDNSINSYFGNIKKPFFSSRNKEKKKEIIKDNKTNKEYQSKRINAINNYNSTNNYNSYNSEKYSSTIEQPRSFKKIFCSKLNKRNQNINANLSRDNNIIKDKEKEKDIANYNTEDKVDNEEEKEITGRFKRLRFFTINDYTKKKKENEKKIIEIPQKKENKNLKAEDDEENEQKRKNNKNNYNNFANYIHKRKMKENNNDKEDLNKKRLQEKEEKEEKQRKEKEEKQRKEKEEKEKKEREEKEKEVKEQNNFIRHSKRMVPYRSFKRKVEKKDFVEYNSSKGLEKTEKKENPIKEIEIPKESPRKLSFIHVRKKSEKKEFYKKPKLDLDEENEEDENTNKNDIKINKNKMQENANTPKKEKEENIPSFKQRWKFKQPEAKNTFGKITKDTESSNNSKTNSSSKKKTNFSNEDKDKENSNSISHKSNEHDQEDEDEEDNNNQNNNNNLAFNPITKIQGMSEKLLNHTNRRISNIISKCSIPLMNVEDYTLCQKIGEGSYGIIFSAMNKKDNKKQYALKKIISNKLKQIGEFTKEFELVHLCEHENIMKIYGYCIRILDPTTFALYILMELAERDWDKEIKKKLLQRKNYSEKELINILYQLTSALLYIQEKFHLSHRDIKPQNVLVFNGGKYKLADFGEAKEAKVSRQINTLRGTELFMSPALYNGLKNEKNDVTHNPYKSDVFSLGFCFLYASALNFNLLYEVRDILDSRSINIILQKFLNKFYSEKLIKLLTSMLEIDEAKRFDFRTIKEYIENNYPEINTNINI